MDSMMFRLCFDSGQQLTVTPDMMDHILDYFDPQKMTIEYNE